MKIGVISKEKDADVCSVCTMETREKLRWEGRPIWTDCFKSGMYPIKGRIEGAYIT